MIIIILGLILAIFVAGLFISIGYGIGKYNMFQTGIQDIKTQWSNIKTEYQRRADLFYNLAESVKSYKIFEKSTMVEVIKARSGSFGTSVPKQMKKMSQLDGLFSKLLAVAEAYPNLKANESYNELMKEIRITEDRVNVARTDYNEIVGDFNKQVKMFPSNFIAQMFHFTEQPFFANEAETYEAPKLSLG
jgi:LemA protein